MFANKLRAGFADGNMFTGLFGSHLFVRLTDDDREQLLARRAGQISRQCLAAR